MEKDGVIEQMRVDNVALAQACKDKDEEIEKLKLDHTDLKSKHEKQKKLLVAQKKTKKLVREKDREIMKFKKELADKAEEANRNKEELTKKLRDRDFDVQRLKVEAERERNKAAHSMHLAEAKLSRQNIKQPSNPSTVRDTTSEKKHKEKVSDKEIPQYNADLPERLPTKTSAQGTPKSKEPVKLKSLKKLKDIKELSHPIQQLKCKMNEHKLDIKSFIDKIVFNNEAKPTVDSKHLLERMNNFLEYSQPEEVEDLCHYFSQNQDPVGRQQLTNIVTASIHFRKFDESSGRSFMLIFHRKAVES